MCGAWAYINGVPHLGNLIGSELSADIFARYLRLKGEDVLFVSGSDEHGTPIEVEAVKSGIPPQDLTDNYHNQVVYLFEKFGISFDNYSRTHSPTHIRFCQEFFKTLYEKGHIFAEEVKQLYCNKDNRFLPDRFVLGICPNCSYDKARGDQCENCGKVLDPLDLSSPSCAICGEHPVVKTSRHWFFNLPKFTDRIKVWLENNTRLPENARRFSLKWIEEGLRPRSVTRDNEWGIPAPFRGSERKTIYVWFEALLGYITASVEWAIRKGRPESWKDYWTNPETRSVYFIGKDNIPYHTIILTALLTAYDERLVLPWNVSSTEYLTFEGRKFSKSQGVGIWLDDAIKHLEADYWRYYLAKIRPETSDSNFSLAHFREVINSDLNDTIGNFIHRVLTFIHAHFDDEVPEPGELDKDDKELVKQVKAAPAEVGRLLEEFKFRYALDSAARLARLGNSYINLKEPWRTVKEDRTRTATTIYVAVQVVNSLSTLLEPFVPFTARRLRDILNVKDTANSWDRAGDTYLRPGHKTKQPEPLFVKISDEKMVELKGAYG